MKCTIITIGDELLIGQVIDTNSAWIAQRMNEIGISVYRRIAIGDNASEIRDAIQAAFQNSKIVVLTGGLGPTKDDITKKTIADLYQVGWKRDENTYQHVKAFFESRNVPFLPINEAQADVPENADVLFNARGTAPGMWIETNDNVLISLPGVPYEMEHLMQTHVLQRLKEKFEIPPLYYAHIQTVGLGESFLAKRIEDIEDAMPSSISLAYLPSPMSVHLRLSGTFDTKDIVDDFAGQIRFRLEKFVYGDSTLPIEELTVKRLKERGERLTLVESCTGGYISHLLTNIQGASDVLYGSWVVYTNEFKQNQLSVSIDTLEQYTAVSEETIRELFQNALTQSSTRWCIAVVGYLEKSDLIEKPHAIIAYGDRDNMRTERIDLFYPRIKSKEAVAKRALVGLYKNFLC